MGDIVADATVAALTADTIDGLVVASYNEVVADPAGMSPPPADKIVSPSILRSLLDAPYKIGSVASAPEIHVVDLYADSLAGGNIKATLSDISSGSKGRLVTSDILHDWVLAPNLKLGDTTAADASIATLKLTSMDTTSGVLVTGAAISASAENLLVTPKALVDFLTAPTAIGGATRANGSFDALAFTSLDSANLATSDDLAAGTSTTKVVTPSAVGSLFASPPAIGSTKANTGTFTTLTADSIIGPIGTTDNATKNDAYFKTINVQAIAGDVIATSSDIYDGTSSSLLVTPAALQTFFGSPYAIGSGTAAAGSFSDLTAKTINGDVIPPDLATAKDNTINNMVITPGLLSLVFESPPQIGITDANDAIFKNLEFSSISGAGRR
jgi:hypothetical protein